MSSNNEQQNNEKQDAMEIESTDSSSTNQNQAQALSEEQQRLINNIFGTPSSSNEPAPAAPTPIVTPIPVEQVQVNESESQKIRREFDTWKRDNNYIDLRLESISEPPERSLHFALHSIGMDAIQFQLYCNDNWQPMFFASDSPILEEHVSPINFQIEEQSHTGEPLGINQLLNMFALAFNDFSQSMRPTPAISTPFNITNNNIDSNGNITQANPIASQSMTNYPIYPTHNEPEPEEVITPTAEDWNNVIYPEVRAILARDDFPEYEVEEWMRRVQVAVQKNDISKALQTIQYDILGGALPPPTIQKFFHRRARFFNPSSQNNNNTNGTDMLWHSGEESSEEAKVLLQAEVAHLKELNTKELGFVAQPIQNHLFHWQVRLIGFGHDSKLGQDLTEWSLKRMSSHLDDSMKEVEHEVLLEIKFPPTYPHQAPMFRVVRPRFENLEVDLTPTDDPMISSDTTTTTTTTTSSNNKNPFSLGESTEIAGEIEKQEELKKAERERQERKKMTMSLALEQNRPWNSATSMVEMIQHIRHFIIESASRVDMEYGLDGQTLATVGGFWRSFECVPPQKVGRPELESGGKLILPVSALEELSQYEMDKPQPQYHVSSPFNWNPQSNLRSSLRSSHNAAPMIFEISAEHGRRSYCGVEEFTAMEGQVVVPQWILNNLRAQSGEQVSIRRVKLPRGSYLKLQPHNADFLEVNDTRAMFEWVLPNFVVLNTGDTIVIPYRDKKYTFNVLEVKPGNAVHVIDSDITTEFAPPLTGDLPAAYKTSFDATSPTTTTTTTTTTTSSTTTNNNSGATISSNNNAASNDEENSGNKGTALGTMDTSNQVEGVDFKICDNCKHRIPMASYNTHSLACARMNWYCGDCHMVVQKQKKDEHLQQLHSTVYCECGEAMEQRLLNAHKQNDCPGRIVTCSYCPLQMPYKEKFEHEIKCGSQTIKCEQCRRYIQKRDYPVHEVECAMMMSANSSATNTTGTSSTDIYSSSPSRTSFMPSSSPSTSSIFDSNKRVRQEENLMMCPVCMAPFEHLDDLQVHMISAHEGHMEESKPGEPQQQQQTESSSSNNESSTASAMDEEQSKPSTESTDQMKETQ